MTKHKNMQRKPKMKISEMFKNIFIYCYYFLLCFARYSFCDTSSNFHWWQDGCLEIWIHTCLYIFNWCHHRTLTPSDIWSCPIWDLHVFWCSDQYVLNLLCFRDLGTSILLLRVGNEKTTKVQKCQMYFIFQTTPCQLWLPIGGKKWLMVTWADVLSSTTVQPQSH